MSEAADFFRARLDQMIDLRHPLAVLANRMPWIEIEASISHRFAKQAPAGKRLADVDLFISIVSASGAGVSKAGRPRLPMRLMVSLLYPKHAFNESGEGVVERWAETPTWQYFLGLEYFQHRWPCDPSLLVRYRQLLGEAGAEELMARTINVAVNLKLIDAQQLRTMIVDSMVQEKEIKHPTDSKMLETARSKLVEAARDRGIELKQTYAKEGASLGFRASRYAHARQFKRMRRAIKRQRTIMGRLQREIERKAAAQGLRASLELTFAKARQVIANRPQQDSRPQDTEALQLARTRGAVRQQGQEPQSV